MKGRHKTNYVVKCIGFLTAKNKLQEAVQEALKGTDCLLVSDVATFINDIESDINEQVQKHPRCKRESVRVWFPQKLKPEQSVRVNVGDNFMSFMLYKVQGYIIRPEK